MKQQKYYNPHEDAGLISDIADQLNMHKKVVELLFSRGYTSKDAILKFLHPSEKDFHSPFLLRGMKEATETITKAINENKRILIFGDYDVDGMSATAILYKTFEKFGKRVNYYLPNRFVDGYGLTNAVIDKIQKMFNPELIVTVDCGISCKKEVEYAKSKGIEMVVTDHHELPDELPDCPVVNPKIKNQDYPFSDLCGTGVAFKLSEALVGYDVAKEFLPIAAIATIADIVSLKDENRAIVALGMKSFQQYLPQGLRALFNDNKLPASKATSTDIAFKIAPKLNSAGRMGDPADSLRLMLTKNPNEIKMLLGKINDYNTKRQKVCNDCFADCEKMLAKINMSNERAIILCNKNWDHGILGIVAARLVEKYNRPTFLFSEEDGVLKGSARSLLDINVHEILSNLESILVTYGGHKMAAGLTLNKDKLNEFSQKVNSFIYANVSPNVFEPICYYDLELNLDELDDKLFADIQKLEPFGLNNSNPLFHVKETDAQVMPLKKFNCHFNINFGNKLSLIYFNCLDNYFNLKYSKCKNFIFELQNQKVKNVFKGIVKDFEPDFEFDITFKSNLDAIVLEQLSYLNNSESVNVVEYEETEMVNFITELSQNPFGTIFVTNSLENYKKFINKFNLKNIYEKFVFDNYNNGAFNSIIIYPFNVDIFKSYKKIVFLEPVLDASYLKAISEVSNAEFYIPKNRTFAKNTFAAVDLSRGAIASFYNAIKSVIDKPFLNELHLYNKISRSYKISFKNFYAYLLIFKELNFIKIIKEDGIKIEILNSNKKQLNESKIYNKLNFFKQII